MWENISCVCIGRRFYDLILSLCVHGFFSFVVRSQSDPFLTKVGELLVNMFIHKHLSDIYIWEQYVLPSARPPLILVASLSRTHPNRSDAVDMPLLYSVWTALHNQH